MERKERKCGLAQYLIWIPSQMLADSLLERNGILNTFCSFSWRRIQIAASSASFIDSQTEIQVVFLPSNAAVGPDRTPALSDFM